MYISHKTNKIDHSFTMAIIYRHHSIYISPHKDHYTSNKFEYNDLIKTKGSDTTVGILKGVFSKF